MSRAAPHASNHGLSGSTTNSVRACFSRNAASIAALRVTPPINNTRLVRAGLSPAAQSPCRPCCRAAVQISSGVASFRLSLCVMSDLQWTEQRAASGTTLPANERRIASSRLIPIRPTRLHEELAAPGGAFVVRQNIGDSAVLEEINQERLAAQGNHGIKISGQLVQRALDGGHRRCVPNGRTLRKIRR